MMKKLILPFLVMVLLALNVSANCVEDATCYDNITLYLSMDAGNITGGVLYDIDNRVDGTISGATQTASGVYGDSYLSFDGNDKVEFGADREFDMVSDQTVTCWIRRDNTGGHMSWYSIDSADGFYDLYLLNGADEVFFEIEEDNGAPRTTTISNNGDISINNWHMISMVYNYTDHMASAYVNGTQLSYTTFTAGNGDDLLATNNARLGVYNVGAANYLDGDIDECWVANISMTQEDLVSIWSNYTNGINPFFATPAPPAPTIVNFSIQATDNYSSEPIINFNTLIDGAYYQSNSTGYIITHLLDNDTTPYTFTINTTEDGGYHKQTYTNYNVSIDLNADLNKYFIVYNTEYKNNISNGTNYVRNLYYNLSLTCPSFSTTYLQLLINTENSTLYNLICDNSTINITSNYTHSTEGYFNTSFYLFTDIPSNNNYTSNKDFISDLNNPVINYQNISFTNGFDILTTNVSMSCSDNAYSSLLYNFTFNNNSIYYGNKSNNTIQTNITDLINGQNILKSYCSDLFGTTYSNYTKTGYKKTLILIDEKENNAFDVSNLTSVRVYYDDNSTLFDFKSNATNKVNFTSSTTDKLRFELVYSNGDVITRYVDVSVGTSTELRVCANKDPTTFYEQIALSTTQKAVTIKNVFSNCVVAEDYTRFAYQDSLILRAFTIDSYYSIYTYDNGEQVILASVEGGLANTLNIDQLQFAQQDYDVTILGDALTTFYNGSSTILVLYKNTANDNTDLALTITNQDNNQVIYTENGFADPNEFTIYFNYASFSNITNNTIFKAVLTRTKESGTSTLTKYFSPSGASAIMNNEVAFILAILLFVFGITLTASRTTFSWFGIMICIGSIALLSAGLSSWKSTIMQAVFFVIMVFIFIVMYKQNTETIT